MARFDIHHAMATLQAKAPDWTETALTEVARTMGRDPFKILIGCLLSLRTKDETTGPAAARLFALAGTPEAMLHLSVEQIAKAIYPVGFYRTKAAIHPGHLSCTGRTLWRSGAGYDGSLTRIERGRAENRQPGADDGVPEHRPSVWIPMSTASPTVGVMSGPRPRRTRSLRCVASSRRRIGWCTMTYWCPSGRISVSRSRRCVANARWPTVSEESV